VSNSVGGSSGRDVDQTHRLGSELSGKGARSIPSGQRFLMEQYLLELPEELIKSKKILVKDDRREGIRAGSLGGRVEGGRGSENP